MTEGWERVIAFFIGAFLYRTAKAGLRHYERKGDLRRKGRQK